MTTDGPLRAFPFSRPHPMQPAAELAKMRIAAPVSRVTTATGGEVWMVTRYDDARFVLSDRRFSLAAPGVTDSGGPNDSIFQDPPGHARLRRLVSQAFTARRVSDLRARVAQIADGLIDEMASEQKPVDLMQAFALPLPITVICELLGVAAPDRDNLRAWSDAILFPPGAGDLDAGLAGASGGTARPTDQRSGRAQTRPPGRRSAVGANCDARPRRWPPQ